MRLATQQACELLAKRGIYVKECCGRCGRLLGPVSYTRKGEDGVWCSRECRGDVQRQAIPMGGRPRKHETGADRQRAYRGRVLGVTKPSRSFAETKELQAQKSPLSTTPLTRPLPGLETAANAFSVEEAHR